MKKSNKRTWLFLAGIATLSVTLLSPVILSACSTVTPPLTENPNDYIPNKLENELEELNISNNKSARKNIYDSYINSLNLKSSGILTNSGFIDELAEMISNGLEPSDDSSQMLNELFSQENKSSMTQEGLIPEENLSLVTKNGEPEGEEVVGKSGSFWGKDAFKFKDSIDPTWSFWDNTNKILYDLYLTENVEFKFASTQTSISVEVKNLVGNNEVKSRLVVTKEVKNTENPQTPPQSQRQEASNPTPVKEVKEYNFKDNIEFKLPTDISKQLTSFVTSYNDRLNASKGKLKEEYMEYQSKLDNHLSAATIWNQFVRNKNNELLSDLASDLNVNRQESNVAKWIIENISKTSTNGKNLVDEFIADLKVAKSVNLEIDSLIISGNITDNNGLNNFTGEEPDYTFIVTFEDKQTQNSKLSTKTDGSGESGGGSEGDGTEETPETPNISLDEKWYILNLKATNFEFNTKINDQFFGYQSSSFTTTPSLKLDGKSSFSSYQLITTEDTVGGYQVGEVKKIDQSSLSILTDSMTDVSLLYDLDNNGFSKFLSSLIVDTTNGDKIMTDRLIGINSKPQQDTLSKLQEYLNANEDYVKKQLLEPDVLADLILNNIDLSNMAMHSNSFANKQHWFPLDKNISSGHNKGWRSILNDWVKGGSSPTEDSIPEVLFKNKTPTSSSRSSDYQPRNDLAEKADITVRAKLFPVSQTSDETGIAYPLIFGQKELRIRSIYVFLGNGVENNALVSESGEQAKSASLDLELTGAVNEISSNAFDSSGQPKPSSELTTLSWDEIISKVDGKFCIVFEQARWEKGQSRNDPPIYAFYMGQQKVESSQSRTGETTQSKFSISLDALLGDGSKFLNTLLS